MLRIPQVPLKNETYRMSNIKYDRLGLSLGRLPPFPFKIFVINPLCLQWTSPMRFFFHYRCNDIASFLNFSARSYRLLFVLVILLDNHASPKVSIVFFHISLWFTFVNTNILRMSVSMKGFLLLNGKFLFFSNAPFFSIVCFAMAIFFSFPLSVITSLHKFHLLPHHWCAIGVDPVILCA